MKFIIFLFFIAYFFINFYVYFCINRALSLNLFYKIILIIIICIMVFGVYFINRHYLISENIIKPFALICYSYLGFIFLLFSFLVFYDLISLIFNFFNLNLPYNKAFISILLFTIVIFIYGYLEAGNIVIKKVYINSSKINKEVKIAYLSDIHLGITTLEGRVRKLIRQLKNINPDIIILGGDFIDGQHDNIDKYVNLFRDLNIRYGKYAVLGNHEYYAGRLYSEGIIKSAGFVLLNNESAIIKDLNICITGIEDIVSDKAKELNLLKSSYNNKCFNIYLKHKPIVNSKAINYFDLQLSGHTHNGQIFPFGLLEKLHYKYMSGLYKLKNNTFIYVSKGTLTWGPPIRVLAKPEISLININKN